MGWCFCGEVVVFLESRSEAGEAKQQQQELKPSDRHQVCMASTSFPFTPGATLLSETQVPGMQSPQLACKKGFFPRTVTTGLHTGRPRSQTRKLHTPFATTWLQLSCLTWGVEEGRTAGQRCVQTSDLGGPSSPPKELA